MKKQFNEMKIKQRLNFAFTTIIVLATIVNIIGAGVIFFISYRYDSILREHAFPQGDIGKAMTVFSEVRSTTRGAIGYDDPENIEQMKKTHAEKLEALNTYVADIESSVVTEEGREMYEAIQTSLAKFIALDAEILEQGATTDETASHMAQKRAYEELSPVFDECYNAFKELMSVKISKGDELAASLNVLRYVMLGIVVLFSAVLILISAMLSKKISRSVEEPMVNIAERLKGLAAGDLKSPFPVIEAKDEIAEMREEAANMAENLNVLIADLEELMKQMAEGNFDIRTRAEERYVGEFNQLLASIRKMNMQMSGTLTQVNEASEQVAAGAGNMAEAAQALAEGATDQAASVEEMQATIENLTEGVSRTAEKAEESKRVAEKYSKQAEEGRIEMDNMVAAMERISETSKNIGNIISQIEDIASQTNLLSLNAAIEAARAGEAGKGFAVVADQIRSLAEQSAKSAVDTRELIEGSLQEVEEGNKAALNVASTLAEVVEGVNTIAGTAGELSRISQEQANAMKQAEAGIDRISEVVQSNSATAEEASATSQELSAQATSLGDLVGRFILRK